MLAPESLIKDFKDPIVMLSLNALKLPKRDRLAEYVFSNLEELVKPPSFNPMDFAAISAHFDIDGAIAILKLSELQSIFVPPHFVPAMGIEIAKVEESRLRSEEKSGALEMLKTEIVFKENNFFERLIVYSKESLRVSDLLRTMPAGFEWARMNDVAVKLPVEKKPDEETFRKSDQSFYLFEGRAPFGDSFDSGTSGTIPSLSEYLSEPQWTTRKGFDRWGAYYEGAEARFSDGTRLRVEIRGYGWQHYRGLWPNDPLYSPSWWRRR